MNDIRDTARLRHDGAKAMDGVKNLNLVGNTEELPGRFAGESRMG